MIAASLMGSCELWFRTRVRALAPLQLATHLPSAIWSHRGYTADGAVGNSLEALDAAVDRGYSGIEVDVRYVDGVGIFVSYDPIPPGGHEGLLSLEAFLSRHGPALFYWIDFKNLGPLNGSAAAAALAEVLQDPALAARCVVESRWPHALAAVRDRLPRVHLLPIIHPHPALGPLARFILAHFDFHALSMDHRWIDETAMAKFGHLMVFTYTVDDLEELERLTRLGVDVVLTDELPPPGDGPLLALRQAEASRELRAGSDPQSTPQTRADSAFSHSVSTIDNKSLSFQ